MANQFKIKGLEDGNQVTRTTNITIEIKKSVYANFDSNTDLNFEIDGDKKAWPRVQGKVSDIYSFCLLYTSPSPRDRQKSRMPSSA